jgi:acetyl/propionyl-CoA carboxylase alpha subunit
MEETLLHNNKSLSIRLEDSGESMTVHVDGHAFAIGHVLEFGNELRAEVDGRREDFFVCRDGNDGIFVFYRGRQYIFKAVRESQYGHGGIQAEAGDYVAAPMPGTVIKINCTEGDRVAENDTLVVVEAMKMENLLRSPISGTITKVHNKEGDLVDAGAPIVEIEAED